MIILIINDLLSVNLVIIRSMWCQTHKNIFENACNRYPNAKLLSSLYSYICKASEYFSWKSLLIIYI